MTNAAFWNAMGVTAMRIDQQDNNGQSLAGTVVGQWHNGAFRDITIIDQPQILGALDLEVVRGYQGIHQSAKFNNWQNTPSFVINHHEFVGEGVPFDAIAELWPTSYDIKITTDLIDAPGTSGGNIKFHDPWYMDYQDAEYGNNWRNRGMEEPRQFYTRNVDVEDFNPDFITIYPEDSPYPYFGVFLNQTIGSGTYYSVEVTSPQSIAGFNSYFLSWSGTDVNHQNPSSSQTGVTFLESGAVSKAVYKPAFGSSISDATSVNGQRKYVQNTTIQSNPASSADAFVIYESIGDVWLTTTPTQGGPSNSVFQITDGTGSYTDSYPSMAVGNTDDLYIVYRKPGDDRYFSERKGGVWQEQEQINITNGSGDAQVISRTNTQWVGGGPWLRPFLVAVWESDGIKARRAHEHITTGEWDWFAPEEPLEIFGYGNPSLSSTYLKGDGLQKPSLFLTFDDNEDIFLREHEGGVWTVREYVPGSVGPPSSLSQVSADTRNETNRKVHVVWETAVPTARVSGIKGGLESSSTKKVIYQGKSSQNGWSTATKFQSLSQNYQRPSISNMTSGNLVMVWDNGTDVYKATKTGSGWSSAQVSGAGTHAQLINSGTKGPLQSTKYVSMGASGPPYPLQVSAETFSAPLSPEGENIPEIYSRAIEAATIPPADSTGSSSMTESIGYFSIELSQIQLKLDDGSLIPLEFVTVNDTIPGLDGETAWEKLETVGITIPSGIDSCTSSKSFGQMEL